MTQSVVLPEPVNEQDKDAYLADYLLKRKWIDPDIPMTEIDPEEIEDEEKELDKIDEFESKYNFRFEELESGAAGDRPYQVMGHAREVAGSLRRTDDSRKRQREQRKEKK